MTPETRIARELVEFSKSASQTSTPLHKTVEQLLTALSAELEPEGGDHVMELSYVVSVALGLAAETFCTDGFARARTSDRQRALFACIEEHIVGRERRSRERGGELPAPLNARALPAGAEAETAKEMTGGVGGRCRQGGHPGTSANLEASRQIRSPTGPGDPPRVMIRLRAAGFAS